MQELEEARLRKEYAQACQMYALNTRRPIENWPAVWLAASLCARAAMSLAEY